MSDPGPSFIQPLPVYVQNQLPQSPFEVVLTRISVGAGVPDARVLLESFIESQKAPAYNESQQKAEAPKPIEECPMGADPLTRVKQQIVMELFNAIGREDSESIAILIQNNLVTANTRSTVGQTPLLEAISTKIFHLVKELLEFGADPNAFGVVDYGTKHQASRTPLMLAATTGSLPIVKLLFEPPYSADDTLVAPDGQIALRLAAEADHRPIVEYLPSLRAGGFLRWKTQHALAIARMKKALRKIGTFVKFFIWELPKFFLWSIPKHVVVLPVVRSCKWCWTNRKKIGAWCKHQITEMPKRVARAGKLAWKAVKKIPKGIKATGKALWKFGTEVLPRWMKNLARWFWDVLTVHIPKAMKELWKFGTQTLPRWIKKLALWFWELLTVRIPKATVIVAKWIWSGISSFGKAAWDVVLRIVSFLDTIFQAVITFLRNLTLRDIWNGFCDILRAVFVTLPKTLWSWIVRFGEASYEAMKALFGWFGEFLWCIASALRWLVLYIPTKLWVVLESLGSSIARGWLEFMVWINPKL